MVWIVPGISPAHLALEGDARPIHGFEDVDRGGRERAFTKRDCGNDFERSEHHCIAVGANGGKPSGGTNDP